MIIACRDLIPVTQISTRTSLLKISISRKEAKTWSILPLQDPSMTFLLRRLRLIRRMRLLMDRVLRPERFPWTLRIISVGKVIVRKSLTTCTTKVKTTFLLREFHVIFRQAWRKSVKIHLTPRLGRWESARSRSNLTCISTTTDSMGLARVISPTGRHRSTILVGTRSQNNYRKM